MVAGDAHVFPGFLTSVPTQLSFQSHRLLFPHAFSRGKRRKYAGKKVRLNRVSNSQPPGHESDTFNTELPGRVGGLETDVQIYPAKIALQLLFAFVTNCLKMFI